MKLATGTRMMLVGLLGLTVVVFVAQQLSGTPPPPFDCYSKSEAADQPCKFPGDCAGCWQTGEPDPEVLPPLHGKCLAQGTVYSWFTVYVCDSDANLNNAYCVIGTPDTYPRVTCFHPYTVCLIKPEYLFYECVDVGTMPGNRPGEGACNANPNAASCSECDPGSLGPTTYIGDEFCGRD